MGQFLLTGTSHVGATLLPLAKEVSTGCPPHERDCPDFIDIPERRYFFQMKRVIDITVAGFALLFFTLLFPVIALAIKFDSPGPIFFFQTRVGIDRRRRCGNASCVFNRRKVLHPGRPFRLIKLRTMRMDAEKSGPRWATHNDERVTRLGRFLRRSRLDEFPQFYNVLKGDMSFIGPRPERLCFIRQLEPQVVNYRDRLRVLPGITGLAQVLNGYDTDVESVRRKVALDRHYIKNIGLKMDLAIFLGTFRILIGGHGAH